MTIILPWLGFLFAILWMIWQGDKAKEEYVRRRKIEERTKAAREAHEDALVEMLGAGEHAQTKAQGGYGQSGQTRGQRAGHA